MINSRPGAAKTQAFDALQRHTRIEVRNNASQLLASKTYQYDLAGNIAQIDTDLGKTQYGYDKLSRLTQASPDNSLKNLGLPQEQYSYDPVGNRTSSAHQPGMWSYNADNQLIQYPRTEPFSGNAPKDTRVTFTAQGHMAQEKSGAWQRDYRYNAAERLIETSQNGQSTSYRYDPFGRRISKSSGNGVTATTTYYIYTDTGLMAEADSRGQMSKAYGFNPKAAQQGLWSTDPIWQADMAANSLTSNAASYHYLHTDHLAAPMLATDRTGYSTWKGASEAFGATTAITQATAMNLRFPGQYWDEETQTHYNFHRDYMPGVGRYTQSDPIGLGGGMNVYLYAAGNPLYYFDFSGRSPGGWGSIGKPPVGDVNNIYRVDGRLELYIMPIKDGAKCPTIEKCLRVHEDTHRKDAISFDSDICRGKNNVAVGYYGENGRSYRDSSFAADAELRALENQISCLKKSLQEDGCDTHCKNWVEAEIRQREN